MYCKICSKEIGENERYEHLDPSDEEFNVEIPMIVCERCYWDLVICDDGEEEC